MVSAIAQIAAISRPSASDLGIFSVVVTYDRQNVVVT